MQKTINTIVYFAPFIVLGLVLKTLSIVPWYMGLPLALMEFLAMHVGIVKYLVPIPSHDALWKTPYFSCIFQASAFWVLVTWVGVLVPGKFQRMGSLGAGVPGRADRVVRQADDPFLPY